MRRALAATFLAVAFAATACHAEEGSMPNGDFTVASKAFGAGERIPRVHAHGPEGDDQSPPLSWRGAPEGTRQLALVVDDPDAPRADPWVHWVLYAIPPAVHELPPGTSRGTGRISEPRGPIEGMNDFGDLGWGGPLPPPGHGAHHYHFKLYALDEELNVGEGASKADLLRAMEGHVLAEAELVGTYER